MRKKLIQLDADTGEEQDGVLAWVPRKKINGFGNRWFAMNQNIIESLSLLRGEESHRVLWAVLGKLDFENFIMLNQAEIARDLDMHRQHVNRAIKQLETLTILLRGPKSGKAITFRLNPNFGWKGQSNKHITALDEYREQKNRKRLEEQGQMTIPDLQTE